MQSPAQRMWIHNPSASTITVTDGIVDIDGQIQIKDVITACMKQCASPCVPQITRITFQDIDFGDCNGCPKDVGFHMRLLRNPNFDTETYPEMTTNRGVFYQGIKQGVVTAGDLADWFVLYINTVQEQNDQHDFFAVDVIIDPGDPNSILITSYCDNLVGYNILFSTLEDNNLLTTEEVTITEVQAATPPILTKSILLREFPWGNGGDEGWIFGSAPNETFTYCENICKILLRGCYDPCDNFVQNQGSGYTHTGATPFTLMLFVNSDAPGFADFVNEIISTFTNCTGSDIDTSIGINNPGAQGLINGGGANIDLSSLDFSTTKDWKLYNGLTTVIAQGVTSKANLASVLGTVYPSGAFTYDPIGDKLIILGGLAAAATSSGDYIVLTEL